MYSIFRLREGRVREYLLLSCCSALAPTQARGSTPIPINADLRRTHTSSFTRVLVIVPSL